MLGILPNFLRLPALIAGFGVMGAMKVTGDPWEKQLYRRFGYNDDVRVAAGIVEATGALMLASPRNRRLGALLLAAISVPTLAAELNTGQTKLVAPRATLLALVLGVLFGRR